MTPPGIHHATGVPAERLARQPLLTARAWRYLEGLLEHPHAPRWNHLVGDRILPDDLEAVDEFRRALARPRAASAEGPPDEVVAWARSRRPLVPAFRDLLPRGLPPGTAWADVPTTRREDLATRIESFVPDDADLSRLVVHATSGTTGHALVLPMHPRSLALSHALLERALARHGVAFRPGPDRMACAHVCAQARTFAFANVFTVWGHAGFTKVNLSPDDWPGGLDAARRFLGDVSPEVLAGDPVSFAELLRLDAPVRPLAMIATAVALDPGLARRLAERFGCPVIDWYSTTETGPIGFASPDGAGFEVVSHDLYVEAVDEAGTPVPAGVRGEIAVTGGRNPYLPLLRYRTGDFGRVVRGRGPSGEGVTRILDLEGRRPVALRAADGRGVNPVDVGRALRMAGTFVQHAFLQRADGSCLARVRPVPGVPVDVGRLAAELRALFGAAARVEVVVDERLGSEGKVVPYRSELAG